MEDLLNSGLRQNLLRQLVRNDGFTPQDFLNAVETLFTSGPKEAVSQQSAEALWNDPAHVFFGAPLGAVRSRREFVSVLTAHSAALPPRWEAVLSRLSPLGWPAEHAATRVILEANSIARFLTRQAVGGRYFWLFDGAALFMPLVWASLLAANTQEGHKMRLALRIKLAAASSHHFPISELHAALQDNVFRGPSEYLQDLTRRLGRVGESGYLAPSFEDAMLSAGSEPAWDAFLVARLTRDLPRAVRYQ